MNFEIIATQTFSRQLKVLGKRHRSLKSDISEFINSLKQNPLQGDEIAPNIRKIRLAITSKGKGKSGGARIITYTIMASIEKGLIYLVYIYDKSDYESVDEKKIQELLKRDL